MRNSRKPVTLPVKETVREARMRRLANKHGLRLHKSKRNIDKGMYSLIDAYRNFVVFGYNSNLGWCEATLDEVEEYLKEDK